MYVFVIYAQLLIGGEPLNIYNPAFGFRTLDQCVLLYNEMQAEILNGLLNQIAGADGYISEVGCGSYEINTAVVTPLLPLYKIDKGNSL